MSDENKVATTQALLAGILIALVILIGLQLFMIRKMNRMIRAQDGAVWEVRNIEGRLDSWNIPWPTPTPDLSGIPSL